MLDLSFHTSPNRILVKDAVGHTTLDTSQPMPHILQTATVSLSVSFPTSGSSNSHQHTTASYMFNYQDCQMQYVCGYQNVCVWETRNGVYGYYCDNVNVCEWKNVCTTKQGWRNEVSCSVLRSYQAREWEQVQNIASIINGIDADFIQVKVSGSRTAAGTDPWYGTFVGTLPAGEILSQGSMILESAFQPGGASWLRRIMSIYVENGIVKVKFKSSNKAINGRSESNGVVSIYYDPPSQGTPVNYPDPASSVFDFASSFNLTFHVTIGKFTQ